MPILVQNEFSKLTPSTQSELVAKAGLKSSQLVNKTDDTFHEAMVAMERDPMNIPKIEEQ